MALRWRYEGSDGAVVSGPEITFEAQTDAEQWLEQQWQTLLDDGIEAVTLLDGLAEVYGPMSLRPDGGCG